MMYEFPRLTAHHIQTTDQPVVTSTNEMAKERLKVKDQPFPHLRPAANGRPRKDQPEVLFTRGKWGLLHPCLTL